MAKLELVDATNLVVGIGAGSLTGAATSYGVAWWFNRRAERRERYMSILEKAHDVAHDCQSLLEMTDQIRHDLACRKYAAHELAKNTTTLSGEEKRRTINWKTMRVHLEETPRGFTDNLAIALHAHITAMPYDDGPSPFNVAKEVEKAAFALGEELKKIPDFRTYFAQVQFKAESEAFVDFIEAMEQDEESSYKQLILARDELWN